MSVYNFVIQPTRSADRLKRLKTKFRDIKIYKEFKLIATRNSLEDKRKLFSSDDYPEWRDGMVLVHERDSTEEERDG